MLGQSLNCTLLVPAPIDTHPVRSPQAIHSAITRHISGKAVVEIGTRNGDGMACFARATKSAVAVEMDPAYCKKLEQRAVVIGGGAGPAFSVRCDRYQNVKLDDADVFTWWQQSPHLQNVDVLKHLRKQQLGGSIRSNALAIVLFEHGFPDDMQSFRALRNYTSWSETVRFDERALCSRMLRRKPWFWSRAHGSYRVVGIQIADVRL